MINDNFIMGNFTVGRICNYIKYHPLKDVDGTIDVLWRQNTPTACFYHQDDDETIQDKCEYLINSSIIQANKIQHKYVTEETFKAYTELADTFLEPDNIIFKRKLNVQPKKVCFWKWNEFDVSRVRHLTNKTKHLDFTMIPRIAKSHLFTESQWNMFYNFLTSQYKVVELFYRTPIREVMYHLATCEFSIGHGGMYHSFSTGIGNPHISLHKNDWVKPVGQLNEKVVTNAELNYVIDNFDQILHEAKEIAY